MGAIIVFTQLRPYNMFQENPLSIALKSLFPGPCKKCQFAMVDQVVLILKGKFKQIFVTQCL